MSNNSIKIDVIVVTYNRLSKLKKALNSYDDQSDGIRNIIVVDNCSTDGTHDYLTQWEKEPGFCKKIIITTDKNIGGSGGFFLGQKKALEFNADWVFLADDDAYVSPSLFKDFLEYVNTHEVGKLSAICTSVLNPDRSIDLCHRDRLRVIDGRYVKRYSPSIEEYYKESFEIDLLSYVGSFINCHSLLHVGLVNPDYFIYFDDSEHSLRLKKDGAIICVPNLHVIHDAEKSNAGGLSWKDFYAKRNEMHMLIKHMPFGVRIQLIASFLLHYGRNLSSNPSYLALYRRAVWQALFNKLGVDTVYYPGCKMP